LIVQEVGNGTKKIPLKKQGEVFSTTIFREYENELFPVL